MLLQTEAKPIWRYGYINSDMIKIVDMTAKHADVLHELEKVCFAHPWTKEDFIEETRNENAHFLVAECDDEVLGYIGIQEICFEGYVTNVAVFPEHRRKGVAKALIEKALCDAEKRDCDFLTLEVRESNFSARNLYEKLGFIVSGERKNFYRDPDESAILMIKNFKE